MWFFVAGTVAVLIVSWAAGSAAVKRHRKRQQRSMRDHLNRISRASE
jgi:hypothetical protein